MRIKGKALRLSDLGEMSEKAKASWDHFGFDQVAEPGSLCAEYGWDGWRAVLSGSEAVIVMDESLNLNTSTGVSSKLCIRFFLRHLGKSIRIPHVEVA